MDYGHKVYHDLMRQAKDSKPCKICGKHVRSQRNSKTQVRTEVMSTDRELDEQLEQILERLMAGTGVKIHTGGRYQMGIELPEATEAVKSLLTEATREAEIQILNRLMPRPGGIISYHGRQIVGFGDGVRYMTERIQEELKSLQRTKNKEEGS